MTAAAAASGDGWGALGSHKVVVVATGWTEVDTDCIAVVAGDPWVPAAVAVVLVRAAPRAGEDEEHAVISATDSGARTIGARSDDMGRTEGQGTLSAVLGAVLPSGHPAAYDVLVGLHVAAAVIGFGSVAITGAYGAIGRRTAGPDARPQAVEEVRRYFQAGSALEYLVLLAPVFGVAAMAVRPGGGEFAQTWAVAGTGIWIVAGGILLAVIRPAERRIRAAGADLPAVAPEARRLMYAAAACDVLFVVALFVMVTQPR